MDYGLPDDVLVYRPEVPVTSIVLLLHGASLSAEHMMRADAPMEQWQRIADEQGVLLVAPEGSNRLVGGGDNYYWNDCTNGGRLYNPDRDDVALLSDLLDRIGADEGVPVARRYVQGISNGGGMALRLAREASAHVGGVVSILGLDPETQNDECAQPTEIVPVMLVHGTADRLTPYAPRQTLFGPEPVGAEGSWRQWQQRNGVSGEAVASRALPAGSVIDGDVQCRQKGAGPARSVLCTMQGAGHMEPSILHGYTWQQLLFGQQSRDVESARLAWDFFTE